MKRAADTATRAGDAIERFIERTLAPRLEELAGEIRGLRSELGQFDKRLTDRIVSLRNEMTALRGEMIARIDGVGATVNARIDGLAAAVNARIDGVDARLDSVNTRIDALASQTNTRIDSLGEQVNTRIDALTQRVDDALNIRERLVALEAKFVARSAGEPVRAPRVQSAACCSLVRDALCDVIPEVTSRVRLAQQFAEKLTAIGRCATMGV